MPLRKQTIFQKHFYDVKRLMDIARENEKILSKKPINFKLSKLPINFEALYKTDILSKNGFDIDTSVRYEDQSDITTLILNRSIFSWMFGVRDSDPQAVQEKKYSCSCGHSNEIAGALCPECGTYVKVFKCQRGWFLLNKYKVPHPDLLNLLCKNKCKSFPKIDKSKLKRAKRSKYPWLFDVNFKFNILRLQDRDAQVEFIKTYAKASAVDFFLDRIDMFMTSKIPVVSKDVRHHSVTVDLDGTPNVRSHPLNTCYILMNNKIDDLNKNGDYKTYATLLKMLSSITESFADVHDITYDQLGKGKGSDIRGNIAGVKRGHSIKMIVEQSPGFKSNECVIGYAPFAIATIDMHTDIYNKHGLTADARSRIEKMVPNVQDKIMIAKVLREMQQKDLAIIFGYRPPALYRCSQQGLFITGLMNDYAIRVSEIALGGGAHGDHDGDTMLFFMIPELTRMSVAFAFSPRIISYDPITGMFGGDFELPESIYFSVYSLFKEEFNLDEVLMKERDTLKHDSIIKDSDAYGVMYNQEVIMSDLSKEDIEMRRQLNEDIKVNFIDNTVDIAIEEEWWDQD